MKINTAKFLTSAGDYALLPAADKNEYAFIGRSNVGKSSLINMLCRIQNLAKTSQTPGKTRLINYFTINESWVLVDLPGYGYAKISKKERESFGDLIQGYILTRKNLVCTFVLIDSRLEPQKIDLDFMQWMGESGLPFAIVFTKQDKLSKNETSKNLALYKKTLLETWEELPPVFLSSGRTGMGRGEILEYIDKLNEEIKQP